MGQESQLLLRNTTKWTEKMYDMRYDKDNDDKNEVLQYVKNNGGNGIVYIEYSYKQLGLSFISVYAVGENSISQVPHKDISLQFILYTPKVKF